MKKGLFASLAFLSLFGCSQQETVLEAESETEQTEIQLASTIAPQATRGTNLNEQSEIIKTGQKVGVTITGASSAHQNKPWTSDGLGNLTNEKVNAIYYNWNSIANIVAYHPYNAEWTDIVNGSYSFNVDTDQSADGYANSDLLWATATARKSDTKVLLGFKHMLAKLTVKLTSADGVSMENAKVYISGTNISTSFRNGELANATPNISEIFAGQANQVAAIVIPQAVPTGTKLVRVQNGDEVYTFTTKNGLTLQSGHSYTIELNVNDRKELELKDSNIENWDTSDPLIQGDADVDELYDYLNFTALAEGSTISFSRGSSVKPSFSYSKDKMNWTAWDNYPVINVAKGETVYFKGNNDGISGLGDPINSFVMTGKFTANGNIMSLIDSDNFPTLETLEYQMSFSGLFKDCTSLVSAPLLPATVLSDYCYRSMFEGCTNLIEAPELPSSTLSALLMPMTRAPEFGQNELAEFCYERMFYGCTSLLKAPELPAQTIPYRAYNEMFSGCSNLRELKVGFLNKTNLSVPWLNGVSETGVIYKPAAATWNLSDLGLPEGWVVEEY